MSVMRLLVLLVVLGISCGQSASPGGQAETIQVGLDDMGRTIVLNAGDRLVVGLEETTSSAAYRWELTGYPEGALDLNSSDQDAGRFEFTATGEGDGPVRLTGRPVCERGQTDSAEKIQCPLLGAGGPGGAPFRLFVLTVRVSAG
jgi:hypothetical protein